MRSNLYYFLKTLGKTPLAAALSALSGVCAAALVYIHYFQFPLFSKRYLLLAVLMAAVITFLILLAFKVWAAGIIAKLSRIYLVFLVLSALVIAIAFTIMFPAATHPIVFLYPQQDVALEFSLEASADQDQGMALTHINTDFRDISFSELEIDGDCDIRADQVYCRPGQNVRISWRGISGRTLKLSFLPTAFDQTVSVHWDNATDLIQLNNPAGQQIVIQRTFTAPVNEALIFRLLMLPVIYLIVLVFLLGFFSANSYAYALAFIWLTVLLVLWPGIIGDVNQVAIDEFFAGQLADWHPVIYTLILAALTKIFSTVSIFLFIQILTLAFVLGWGFAYFEKLGANRAFLWILTLIAGLLPGNLLSVITLTNDIPFSIMLAALTIMVIKIVLSEGAWLNKPTHWLSLAAVSLLAIFFRYNGLPAVGLTLLVLLLFFPSQRKISLAVIGLVAVVWSVVNGPLFDRIGVNRVSEGHFDNILLHHLSAQVSAGTPLDQDQRAYLDSLYPIENWNYSCCTNKAMWTKPDFNKEIFYSNSPTNRSIALDLFMKAPAVELKHTLCASDIIWNVCEACPISHFTFSERDGVYYWTRSYFPQYQENSRLPFLVSPLAGLFDTVEKNIFLSALAWRPAIYLYISIIAVLVFSLKAKLPRALLILAPIFGQSAFLFLFNRTQNFRYQYCAILVAFIALGLMAIPGRAVIEKEGKE